MRKYILVLIGFVFLMSCEKDNIIYSIPHDKLLDLAYDNDYEFPNGFFHEINLSGSVYYENSVSIKPVTERKSIWIELNTDNKEQAKTWSNLSDEYSSVNREMVKENETLKYFEFVRVNILDVNDTLLSRVHRTDYFVSLYDKFTDTDTIGIYNGELTCGKVKELIEYLWSCGALGLYDKVVESKISDSINGFEYTIQSLKIVYGDFGLKDMIQVYDNNFHLDKSTRILMLNRKKVKEIEGNYHNGW